MEKISKIKSVIILFLLIICGFLYCKILQMNKENELKNAVFSDVSDSLNYYRMRYRSDWKDK